MSIYFQPGLERSFGTYPLRGEELASAVRAALATGYRAFDTAQGYGNEADLGLALQDCGVPREQLCITSKVALENFAPERFVDSVRESLHKLKLAHMDVLLLHWAPVDGDIAPSLALLEQAADLGLATHIGVSNYTAAMMRQAARLVRRPLVTNQVEFHPLLDQGKLLAAAGETGIPLSSYCSVARGEVFKYPLFGEIGAAVGKSAAQVALRWILQKGVAINTMSTKPANIAANFDIMDFTLSSVDMARIDALGATNYRVVTSARVPYAPRWD